MALIMAETAISQSHLRLDSTREVGLAQAFGPLLRQPEHRLEVSDQPNGGHLIGVGLRVDGGGVVGLHVVVGELLAQGSLHLGQQVSRAIDNRQGATVDAGREVQCVVVVGGSHILAYNLLVEAPLFILPKKTKEERLTPAHLPARSGMRATLQQRKWHLVVCSSWLLLLTLQRQSPTRVYLQTGHGVSTEG